MASSSKTAARNPLGGNAISEKLSKSNHALWKAQVMAAVRGARLEGHLTGATKVPNALITTTAGDKGEKEVTARNPEFDDWIATDQQVLGFLLSTLARDVLAQVATCNTAAAAWQMLEEMYSSVSRARFINTRIALSNTKKGTLSINEYVSKMKTLADEMTAAGKVVDDDDLVSYIIVGLDDTYEPVISTIVGKDSMTLGEAYSQLLSFEQRLALRHGGDASANLANRGRGGGGGQQRGGNAGNGRGRGNNNNGANRGRGRGNNGGARPPGGVDNRPKCQLCYKRGHTVINCWYRYDEDFVPDEKYAGSATSYGIDTNWYVDIGATDHVTANWTSSQFVTATRGKIKFTPQAVQVWKLVILVILLLKPQTVTFIFAIFYMFLMQIRILFLLIDLFLIILLTWNFTLNILISRIWPRRSFCLGGHAEGASMPFHLHHLMNALVI